jgi:hypothetical protein
MDLSLFLYPAIVLLGILCLISIYTSDGQHKEPQQQQQREQQWGEQPGCQPATTPPPTLEQVLIMQAQMVLSHPKILILECEPFFPQET